MRTAYALSLAALGKFVAAQGFDPNIIANASPTQIGPATVATTSTYSYSVNTAAASASIAADVKPVSASSPPSKAFSNQKRQGYNTGNGKSCRKKVVYPDGSYYYPGGYGGNQGGYSSYNVISYTVTSSSTSSTTSSYGYPTTTVSTSTSTTSSSSSTTTTSSSSTSTTSSSSTSTTSSSTTTTSSSSSTSSTTSVPPTTSPVTTTTLITITTTTTSSTSACPTTPEDGTYCGFINPQDPCAPQPSSTGGPKVSPDTVDAFYAYLDFQTQAENAVTPDRYELVFANLQGAISGGSYITFKPLDTYDVQGCADFCDSTDLCTSFNIYIERDPSQNPSTPANLDPTVWGNDCPLPSSITNYKCTLWGSALSTDMATNVGQRREQFQVVITGSNAYDKTNSTAPPRQARFSAPVSMHSKTISKGAEFFIGAQFFPGPFDPSLCSIFAAAQTAANKAAAQKAGVSTYTPINMFNAAYIFRDDVAWGTFCALYDNVLDESYAGWSSASYEGNVYSSGQSYIYSSEVFDQGRLR